jgi:sigma-B regulation protein RsbU (phosphoserine phosphatase)
MEIVESEARSARQRQIYTGLVVVLLIIAFTVYTVFRHRASLRLRKAHEELKVAYDQLEETTAQKAAIESDLRIASDIQMGMLPEKFPTRADRDDVQLYASLTPAKEVGGDLFDFYFRDEKLFFCIGDVSGKGVPASLFMAVTRSAFRTVSAHESMPNHIVGSINKTIADMNKNNMFVTLFVGVLDLPTGQMLYCNAGHDAPLLVGAGVGELPCDSNIPVGFMPEWEYTLQEAEIYTGTTIFLFTDGLTEAMNVENEEFQMDRINDVAVKALAQQQQEPHQLIALMTDAVHQFVGDAEQSDDLTMMGIQYFKQVQNQ